MSDETAQPVGARVTVTRDGGPHSYPVGTATKTRSGWRFKPRAAYVGIPHMDALTKCTYPSLAALVHAQVYAGGFYGPAPDDIHAPPPKPPGPPPWADGRWTPGRQRARRVASR